MRDVIACDVDDILFEFFLMLAVFHSRMHGTKLRKESFRSYLVHEVWGGTPEQGFEKMRDFYGSEEFHSLPPVYGAPEAVGKLAEKYDLVAVTGRPSSLGQFTEGMLDLHFEGCFTGIRYTDAFGVGGGIPRPKVEVCAEISARTIIEDYHGHAIACADAGMDVVFFDQPWNEEIVLPSGIGRVYSWDEALGLLL